MEVELEQRNHQLHHLLRVLHKALLQLLGVAHLGGWVGGTGTRQDFWSRSTRSTRAESTQATHQHLAGGGLLLQACCLDAEALLVAQVDKLPAVLLRDVLHVLGCTAERGATFKRKKVPSCTFVLSV